jgi:hypothetical protein
MAGTAFSRLASLLGGVVLNQGRLGHQLLGQILIAGATDLEIVGAQVAFAATTGQKNAVAQMALRSGVPALAIRGLIRKEQRRLLRLIQIEDQRKRQLADLEKALEEQRQQARRVEDELQRREQAVKSGLDAALSSAQEQAAKTEAELAQVRSERDRLAEDRERTDQSHAEQIAVFRGQFEALTEQRNLVVSELNDVHGREGALREQLSRREAEIAALQAQPPPPRPPNSKPRRPGRKPRP